jgi:toxin ParE1/3/4
VSYYFHPQARSEHLEHVAFYESRQRGLGARYLAAFSAAMVHVCAAPHRYKIEFPPRNGDGVPGFPCNMLYRQTDTDIVVLAAALHRRRPDYWIGKVNPK